MKTVHLEYIPPDKQDILYIIQLVTRGSVSRFLGSGKRSLVLSERGDQGRVMSQKQPPPCIGVKGAQSVQNMLSF